jgi:hypothetical protein
MALSVFDLSNNPELRTLLEEKMRRQQFVGNRFAQWIGPEFVKRGGGTEEVYAHGPEGPGWTGAPIEHVQAFIQRGRTDMLIPIRNRLTGLPVFGGNQLWGTGEPPAYGHRVVLINRTRKAYTPPTGMEEQKTRQYYTNLIGEANAYLTTWHNDFFPANILSATFCGTSLDLIAPAIAGGRAIPIVSHPNFFVAGSGQVSYAGGRPGTAGYEAAVEAALNGLTGTAAQKMTAQFIRNLVFEAPRLKIFPITLKSGFQFYPIWLKDAAWQQLQADPEFQALAKSLHIADLDKHPLGNGMVAYFGGAAIYVDFKLWCARTNAIDPLVTAGQIEYGPVATAAERAAGFRTGNTMTQFDTGNIAMCVLVGQSMLSVGTGKRMRFTDEMWDHENVKEIGLEYIQSVVRNETYDVAGILARNGIVANTGDFYENTASLVGASWSPYLLSYA